MSPAGQTEVPSQATSYDRAVASARFLVVAAALLWSTSGFFTKSHLLEGWPGPVLAFWRALFASLVLVPLVRRPQWSWRLIPATALFALMNYTYLSAMVQGTAANAIWLQCTAPVWVLIVGVLVFREPAVLGDWLLILCSAAGVLLILVCELSAAAGASLSAVSYGLASGVFYAGVVLSLRQLRNLEAAWIVALNHVVTAIALAPFLWQRDAVTGVLEIHFWPAGMQWFLLAGLGIVQMGLPYVLFARSLKSIPGHEASGIGLIEPVLVPVWVFLLTRDHERPAWWTLAGGGFIFLGLLVRYFGVKAKPLP